MLIGSARWRGLRFREPPDFSLRDLVNHLDVSEPLGAAADVAAGVSTFREAAADVAAGAGSPPDGRASAPGLSRS